MAYIGRTKTPAPLTSADIPDGIVTAADLAPNSVDTSEIADSVTLVTPNLGTPSAVTLTNATFPAGHVIQTEHINTASVYSDNSDVWVSTAFLDTITPKTTTSKIRVQFSSGGSAGSNVWWDIGLAWSGSSIVDGSQGDNDTTPLCRLNPYNATSPSTNLICGVSFDLLLDLNQTNTTDAITFTIRLRGTGSYSYLGGRGTGNKQHTMMTLTEIAQ